jgi:hypothetical protein
MALIGDGTLGSGTLGNPQEMGRPAVLRIVGPGPVDIGDVAEITATFSDPHSGLPVAPTSVTCTVRLPSGETVAPEVDSEVAGTYVIEFEPEEAKKHRVAFDGTGAYQASEELAFRVRERRVPRG